MCGKGEAVLKALKEMPKSGGLSKGVIMVLDQMCRDIQEVHEKFDSRMTDLEGSVKSINGTVADLNSKMDKLLLLQEQTANNGIFMKNLKNALCSETAIKIYLFLFFASVCAIFGLSIGKEGLPLLMH